MHQCDGISWPYEAPYFFNSPKLLKPDFGRDCSFIHHHHTPYCLWHPAAWRENICWQLDLNLGPPVTLSAALPSVLSHHIDGGWWWLNGHSPPCQVCQPISLVHSSETKFQEEIWSFLRLKSFDNLLQKNWNKVNFMFYYWFW